MSVNSETYNRLPYSVNSSDFKPNAHSSILKRTKVNKKNIGKCERILKVHKAEKVRGDAYLMSGKPINKCNIRNFLNF